MTENEAHAQAFENGHKVGDAEGYARGKAEAFAESGDLISRKALLERLSSRTKTAYPNEFYGLMLAHDFVEDAPAIAAQPVKRGRWEWCGEDRFNDAYGCSECGRIAMGDSNYCPNCGARMDGDGDG